MPLRHFSRLSISIHAPPRGATRATISAGFISKISIHAPPRGATMIATMLFPSDVYFNSRPSARGDGITRHGYTAVFNFNSRPSARGDDNHRNKCTEIFCHFNSRPSARGDSRGLHPFSAPSISIHAPPRGATRIDADSLSHQLHFNSRPSARGDYTNEDNAWR